MTFYKKSIIFCSCFFLTIFILTASEKSNAERLQAYKKAQHENFENLLKAMDPTKINNLESLLATFNKEGAQIAKDFPDIVNAQCKQGK